MSATSLTTFFGDAQHTFDFDLKLVGELETLTDAGIGALFQRLVNRASRYADILAVIRLGLIGGGTKPDEAARLVKVYGEGRPIEETYPVAVAVLSALWFGHTDQPAPAPLAQPEPEPEPQTADGAPAPAPVDEVPQPVTAPVVAAPINGFLGDIGSEV